MPLYFAYGSNMDRTAMAARCPGSKQLGPARLARHRFVLTADGYASVLRDPRCTVWGVLWDLALSDVSSLDRYESVASGLYAKLMQPVIAERGARRALVYVARSSITGQPRPGYLEDVVAAARQANLPGDYIREIEAWSGGAGYPATVVAERPVRALWPSPVAKAPRTPE